MALGKAWVQLNRCRRFRIGIFQIPLAKKIERRERVVCFREGIVEFKSMTRRLLNLFQQRRGSGFFHNGFGRIGVSQATPCCGIIGLKLDGFLEILSAALDVIGSEP